MTKTVTSPPDPALSSFRRVLSSRAPFFLVALKSALAAGFSWEVASGLLGVQAGALAVVSAVAVVQVTGWQTVRMSVERVLGVMIGVSLAVLVAHVLGVNILTVTLMIFFAQCRRRNYLTANRVFLAG